MASVAITAGSPASSSEVVVLWRIAARTNSSRSLGLRAATSATALRSAFTFASRALAVTHPTHGADAIAARFREADPPVLGRICAGRFLLDLRGITGPDDLPTTFP